MANYHERIANLYDWRDTSHLLSTTKRINPLRKETQTLQLCILLRPIVTYSTILYIMLTHLLHQKRGTFIHPSKCGSIKQVSILIGVKSLNGQSNTRLTFHSNRLYRRNDQNQSYLTLQSPSCNCYFVYTLFFFEKAHQGLF